MTGITSGLRNNSNNRVKNNQQVNFGGQKESKQKKASEVSNQQKQIGGSGNGQKLDCCLPLGQIAGAAKKFFNPAQEKVAKSAGLSTSNLQKTKVANLPAPNIPNIIQEICAQGKTPLIISDFDGTLVGFQEDPNKVVPPEGQPGSKSKILATLDNLKKSEIPFIILTACNLDRFSLDTMFGQEGKELNAMGLKGNEMRLVLPNEKIAAFQKKWQNKKQGYDIQVQDLGNEQSRLEVRPKDLLQIATPEQGLDGELRNTLEPLGFRIENVGLGINLHWRGLDDQYKESEAQGKFLKIDLKNKSELFQDIKEQVSPAAGRSLFGGQAAASPKVQIECSGEKIDLSYDQLLEYGQNSFRKICEEKLGDQLVSADQQGQLSEAAIYQEGRATYFDQSDNMHIGVLDYRMVDYDKGQGVQELVDLLGGQEKTSPIFLGDSVGSNKDDEKGIAAAKENGGQGVAVVYRTDKEQATEAAKAKRTDAETGAESKLNSSIDVLNFLGEFAEKYFQAKKEGPAPSGSKRSIQKLNINA